MPRKILAPHKEQDGWAYWRVRVTTVKNAANTPTTNPLWLVKKDTLECVKASDIGLAVGYSDDSPGSRIISSRRVEEAVETYDFLKLLTSEGLYASYWPDGEWLVSNTGVGVGVAASGATLREAYYRHKAEAAIDAQQPIESETDDNARYCFNCYFEDTPDGHSPCHECIEDGNDIDWSRPLWVKKHD